MPQRGDRCHPPSAIQPAKINWQLHCDVTSKTKGCSKMSWMIARYELTGDCPLIVKAPQMADRLNSYAKELSAISSKKNKVDADYLEMSRIEFAGGTYMHPELGPVLPGDNIVAAVINSAKKNKEGVIAKSAVFPADPGYFAIQYDGPRTIEELFEDTTPRNTPGANGFRYTVPVVRNRNRIMSTRCIFHDWTAIIDLAYESSIVTSAQVTRWLQKAGTLVGLCERRPTFGRFSVRVISENLNNDAPAAEEDEEAPKKGRKKSLVKA